MTYAAYKCYLRRMQPSVWETASVSSAARYAFNPFFVSIKRLYDIHVTWFACFSRRKGDSATLQQIIIHVFIAAGQIQKQN